MEPPVRNFFFFAFFAAVVLAATSSSAPADLAVVQVGDGSGALSNVATAAFVKQFANSGGAAYNAIALPTAVSGADQPVTLSGTATSEGFLTKSVSGNYLTIGGYVATPGTTSVTSGTNNRVVGRIDLATGTVDSTTRLGDAASLGNIRSVVSNTGGEFWAVTSGGGVRYLTFGNTGATTSLNSINSRVVNISSGQLYTSSAAGTNFGVVTVGSGLPTSSGQSVALLPGFPASGLSSYDYLFADASTLYVADDRSAASGGGIQKWALNSGTWSLQYTLALGTGSAGGARGLAGESDGLNFVLYATTTESSANRLVSVVDTGAGSAFSLLATAPANTAFRGVELFSPVPESSLVAGLGVMLVGLCRVWQVRRRFRG